MARHSFEPLADDLGSRVVGRRNHHIALAKTAIRTAR